MKILEEKNAEKAKDRGKIRRKRNENEINMRKTKTRTAGKVNETK